MKLKVPKGRKKAERDPREACNARTLAETGTYRARLEDTPLYAKQSSLARLRQPWAFTTQ